MTEMSLGSEFLSSTHPEKPIWIRKSTDDLLEKLPILRLILISLDLDPLELLKKGDGSASIASNDSGRKEQL